MGWRESTEKYFMEIKKEGEGGINIKYLNENLNGGLASG